MQSNSTLSEPGVWYLVGNRDGLAVKVVGSLSIGEGKNGKLEINSSVESEQWMRVRVDPTGSLLLVDKKPQCSVTADQSSTSLTAGAFIPGATLLQFPNNEIYVSQNLQRGHAELRLQVSMGSKVVNPATDSLRPVSETASISDFLRPKRSGPAATGPVKVASRADNQNPARSNNSDQNDELEVFIPADLIFKAKKSSAKKIQGSPKQVRQAPKVSQPRRTAPEKTEELEKQSHLPLWFALLFLLGVLFLPANLKWLEVDNGSIDSDVIIQLPKVELGMDPPSTVEPGRSTLTAKNEQPDPPGVSEPLFTETREIFERDELSVLEAEGKPEISAEAIDDLLRTARRLMSQGFLTWPEVNTVSTLQEVLKADPNNRVATVMLEEAAEELLAEANDAYADGFVDSALDMTDEVLTFYPDYPPALAFRSQIVGYR